MFVKKLTVKKKNKILLSYAESFREFARYKTDKNDKKIKVYKNKQRKVEDIGYLEDLLEIYDDPIEHFKAEAKTITANLQKEE